MTTPLHANDSALIRDRPRGDGAEGDWNYVLYWVALDRAVMAYEGTETDVLYGVEMAWRADATAHALLTRGFTFNCQLNVIVPGIK
jgi:hypothetical protein